MWKAALSWRITKADPSDLMMWFDPTCEEPAVRRIPPRDSDLTDLSMFHDLAESEVSGTYGNEEGVPCKGSEANASEENQEEFLGEELPF